jgi:SAM-dependent methyltransferase
MKLNLGSGMKRFHMKDYVNVDILPDAEVVFDLAMGADWPWSPGSIDHIRADNLLEHFDNDEFMFVMNEAHRVLKAHGEFWLRVPDCERWPDGAFGDPTHKRYFFPRSFYYFDSGRDQWKNYGKGYGFKPWIVKVDRVQTSVVGRFFEASLVPVK